MISNLRALMALTCAVSVLAACGGGGGGGSAPAPAPSPTAPATSAACESKRTVAGYDIVLLIGQSNMSGYGAYIVPGFDTTDPRIQQWSSARAAIELGSDPLQHPDAPFNDGRIGPGMSFARTYIKTLPATRKVLLVPAGYRATSFGAGHWNPGDYFFENAVTQTNAALATDAAGNCLSAVLWSQGESDIIARMSGPTYQTALDRLITTLRTRIRAGAGGDTAPFLLGQFSPEWTDATIVAERQAIVNVIVGTPARQRYTAVVSTAGLTSNVTQGLAGDIHLDAASQRVYGVRFYDALATAVANSAAR